MTDTPQSIAAEMRARAACGKGRGFATGESLYLDALADRLDALPERAEPSRNPCQLPEGWKVDKENGQYRVSQERDGRWVRATWVDSDVLTLFFDALLAQAPAHALDPPKVQAVPLGNAPTEPVGAPRPDDDWPLSNAWDAALRVIFAAPPVAPSATKVPTLVEVAQFVGNALQARHSNPMNTPLRTPHEVRELLIREFPEWSAHDAALRALTGGKEWEWAVRVVEVIKRHVK